VTAAVARALHVAGSGPSGAARLSRGWLGGRALTRAEHESVHGPLPCTDAAELVRWAEAVDLRGRGGAAFPFARKARAVLAAGGPAVVVGNGSEGEPASRKDATLLARSPHLVLDGLQLASEAVGAGVARLVVGDERALAAVRRALGERDDRMPVEVRAAPPRFVAGESSAAVRVASGGEGRPAYTLKPTAAGGVDGRPTLVSNVETLAHLAVLARVGVEGFCAVGTHDEPGTALLTLHRGRGAEVEEVALGVPLATVARRGVRPDGSDHSQLGAVLIGGYHGTWLPAGAALGARVSRAGLERVGGVLGAGVVVLLPASACPVVESAPVVRRLAGESAGQCGPCVFGLPAIAEVFDALAAGSASRDDVAALQRWCSLVERRGACGHPDGVARFVRSLLGAFSDEVAAHLAGGCGRPCRGLLPLEHAS
jgi:NADH:ubiquinone oxidoreductase subunit F (NADH-binding)